VLFRVNVRFTVRRITSLSVGVMVMVRVRIRVRFMVRVRLRVSRSCDAERSYKDGTVRRTFIQ